MNKRRNRARFWYPLRSARRFVPPHGHACFFDPPSISFYRIQRIDYVPDIPEHIELAVQIVACNFDNHQSCMGRNQMQSFWRLSNWGVVRHCFVFPAPCTRLQNRCRPRKLGLIYRQTPGAEKTAPVALWYCAQLVLASLKVRSASNTFVTSRAADIGLLAAVGRILISRDKGLYCIDTRTCTIHC